MGNKYWESLCERVNFAGRNGKEDPLHNTLESEFGVNFKWPREYIIHKPAVVSGTGTVYPDIVLEGDGFGIIIEVKAPGVSIGEEQIISYMDLYTTHRNRVKCKYGFLISDKIKIYFRKDPEKAPEQIAIFGFDNDSQDGNDLAEILYYKNCSNEKLSEYMKKSHEIETTVPGTIDSEGGKKPRKKKPRDPDGTILFKSKDQYNETVRAIIEGVERSKEIKINGIERPFTLNDFGIINHQVHDRLPNHKVVYFHILNSVQNLKFWVTVRIKNNNYVARCVLHIDGRVSDTIDENIKNLEPSAIIDGVKKVIFEMIKKRNGISPIIK
jgi:hypothetical protein